MEEPEGQQHVVPEAKKDVRASHNHVIRDQLKTHVKVSMLEPYHHEMGLCTQRRKKV